MKKNKYNILIIILLSTFCSAFTLLPVWKEYKSYQGKFSISLPDGDFTEKIIPIKTALGDLEQHTFYFTPVRLDAENKFYQVTYIDYPEGTFHQDSTELRDLFYETSIDGAAQSVNGKVMYSENVALDGAKGKIWRIDYNKGNSIMKSKAFLIGNRFYTISVATQKARIRNLDMLKYLDSFKYLSKL